MKKIIHGLLAAAFMATMTHLAAAGEHGGQEHGGKVSAEQKVMAAEAVPAAKTLEEVVAEAVETDPSNEDIRATMKAYVDAQAQNHGGTFYIKDPDSGEILGLLLERVHERVGKTGDYYYSCADFKDKEGKMWDLDLDVENNNGILSVVDVRIHKENGVASYTYDEQDNRHSLVEGTKRHLGMHGNTSQMKMDEYKGSMKGSSMEHGGKE